jgi:hypothetical protein
MRAFRRQKWPNIDLYQKNGPSCIKTLNEHELDALMAKAGDRKWSAEGRPAWFHEHRGQLSSATLVIFGSEGPGVCRCIATVIFADGSGGRFTIDVSESDFDSLEDLSDRELVIMAHRYLATYAPVELDENQASSWTSDV